MKYPRGVEHYDRSPGNNAIQGQGGAECGALGAQLAEIPHDLQVVVDAWPTLPEAVRANVVAIVEKAEAARG